MNDDFPELLPGEAVALLAYARLVALLDRQGVVDAHCVADDLEQHSNAVPPQCRQLMLNIAEGLRPAQTRLGVIDGGKKDDDPGPDAA